MGESEAGKELGIKERFVHTSLDCEPPVYSSLVAGITGVSHHAQLPFSAFNIHCLVKLVL
jgi:hypothetical protein